MKRKPFYHAHTDGILEGWIERHNTSKCKQTGSHNCCIFRSHSEACTYLIRRAMGDIVFLKRQVQEFKKLRDWHKKNSPDS